LQRLSVERELQLLRCTMACERHLTPAFHAPASWRASTRMATPAAAATVVYLPAESRAAVWCLQVLPWPANLGIEGLPSIDMHKLPHHL
jgi:hypothetical protein